MKRLSLLLGLLLLLGCLTGCGTQQQDPGTTEPPASGAEVCTYTVYCLAAENGEGIEGVIVNFCTDDACTPVTSGEDGAAVFTGPPMRYHVQIVKVPAGRTLAQEETEWYTEACSETYRVHFAEVGE